MNNTVMYIVWAVAIVIFAVFEGVTVQLVSIWFVFGSIAALISAFCGANIYFQIVIWIVVSVIALLITRPLVKKRINTNIQPTNADRCINEQAIVVEKIDNINASGQVKIDGKIWTARSKNGDIIPDGELVVVKEIQGVKLIVEK